MKILLLVLTLNCSLSAGMLAQDSSSFTYRPKKNKLAAGLLAFAVPGLGHLYVERPKRALAFFAAETAVGVGFIYVSIPQNLIEDEEHSKGDGSTAMLLFTAAVALKVWEIVDVVKCANEFNNKGISLGVAPLGTKAFALSVQYRF